jgi:hypothetical protein
MASPGGLLWPTIRNLKKKYLDLEPKTVDEIIACLKRIRRSIQFWQKKGGRQGYLTFISEFVK